MSDYVVNTNASVPITEEKKETSEATYMPDSLLPPTRNREAVSTKRLSRMDLQRAITDVKRFIENRLENDLNIIKHTAPLAFMIGTGVNDELDGSESKSAVRFTVPNKYIPRGIIPEDEKLKREPNPFKMECEVGDVTHSAIADQWDFEIRIHEKDRTIETLKSFVQTLWNIIADCEDYILTKYPQIVLQGHPTALYRLPKDITFITSEELHMMYPTLDVHDRESAIVDKYDAVFIMGMGWPMADGSAAEEVRSPGYDDWNLNGDIIVKHSTNIDLIYHAPFTNILRVHKRKQHPLTEYRHELSSMGIRVNKDSLLSQLKHRGKLDEGNLEYQKAIINGKLPFSYGGGLGISRLLMLLLRTGHIGEVQVGVWHDAHYRQAMEAGLDIIPDRIVNV
eukprot:15364834-Ditylum_brightwellii.AAC.1